MDPAEAAALRLAVAVDGFATVRAAVPPSVAAQLAEQLGTANGTPPISRCLAAIYRHQSTQQPFSQLIPLSSARSTSASAAPADPTPARCPQAGSCWILPSQVPHCPPNPELEGLTSLR